MTETQAKRAARLVAERLPDQPGVYRANAVNRPGYGWFVAVEITAAGETETHYLQRDPTAGDIDYFEDVAEYLAGGDGDGEDIDGIACAEDDDDDDDDDWEEIPPKWLFLTICVIRAQQGSEATGDSAVKFVQALEFDALAIPSARKLADGATVLYWHGGEKARQVEVSFYPSGVVSIAPWQPGSDGTPVALFCSKPGAALREGRKWLWWYHGVAKAATIDAMDGGG